jgi:hypothetical protein
MLRFANQATDGLAGPDRLAWRQRLADDDANCLAALDWAITNAAETGHPDLPLELATVLWTWWHQQGRHRESNTWLDQVLATSDQSDSEARVAALLQLANTANNLEDHTRAAALYDEVLSAGQRGVNPGFVVGARIGLGLVATATGAYATAHWHLDAASRLAAPKSPNHLQIAYARAKLALASGDLVGAHEALATARRLSDPHDTGIAAYLHLERVTLERLAGQFEAATMLATSCLATFREFGEKRAEATCMLELAYIAHNREWTALAYEHVAAAAAICDDIGDEFGLTRAIEAASLIASESGDHRLAVQLLAIASGWRTRTGTARYAWERDMEATVRSVTESALGGNAFAHGWQTGLTTSLRQTVSLLTR